MSVNNSCRIFSESLCRETWDHKLATLKVMQLWTNKYETPTINFEIGTINLKPKKLETLGNEH